MDRVARMPRDYPGILHNRPDILLRPLLQAVAALSRTIAARDQYTDGHQSRTTRIARAIAQALDMPPDAIEAIRIAGTLHDIGKIAVPAEILTKPVKLSASEMAIIREHPVTGHGILSGIDFPWPIANIVRQHHERLDGSGYPDGLAGDDILIEARVLAVADLLESMSAHRPYRAALGTEAAMAELKLGAGRLYDAQVVAAAVRLASSGPDGAPLFTPAQHGRR